MPWGCSVSDVQKSDPKKTISAAELAQALRYATDWLGVYREQVNALNVYPVPDGDTGTNMHATLLAALRAVLLPARHGKAVCATSSFWSAIKSWAAFCTSASTTALVCTASASSSPARSMLGALLRCSRTPA